MRITPINHISFQKLKMKPEGILNIPERFECVDRMNNPYNVEMQRRNESQIFYQIEIYDRNNRLAGNEENLQTTFNRGFIEGGFMRKRTADESVKGIGTVLHLCKIIELIENGCQYITISSKPGAAKFHIKLLYEPAVDFEKSMDRILQKISVTDNQYLQEYAYEADNLIKEKNNISNYLYNGNKLISRYYRCAEEHNVPYSEIPITEYIKMTLTPEKIYDNIDFFNALFKKHKIDYQL